MEKCFIEAPAILLTDYCSFFPMPDESESRQANCLVRLVVYSTIAVACVNRSWGALLLGLVAVQAIAMTMFFRVQKSKKVCIAPTEDDPLMNSADTDRRLPRCQDDTYARSRELLNAGWLPKGSGVMDAFPQMYTMPIAAPQTDPISFAKSLSSPVNCKTNAQACSVYVHPGRAH